jgi:hypothetical protein
MSDIKNQLRLIQKFKINETNDCVYQCLLKYFEKYEDSKNKRCVGMLNKLRGNKEKYSHPYTIQDINELSKELKISITIKDLLNKEDIKINIDDSNYYAITLINSRYNHVELFQIASNVEEVSTIEYNKIKETSDYYIENKGELITFEKSYKIKNDFKTLYNEWREEYNINTCSIPIESDINKFINTYDDKVHRFFNKNMVIDNNEYKEIDITKAYFNYDKGKYYNGLPSGSYISAGEGMTKAIFKQQYKNKLVGYYDVSIIHNNKTLDYIGLVSGSRHTLFTSEIKLLMKNKVKFEFHNYAISPSMNAPFSNDFLKWIDGDKLTDVKVDGSTKGYCKAVGIMMIENLEYCIAVKPQNDDNEYHKILTDDKTIYKVNDEYKIIRQKENATSLKHMALSIHAYSNTIILEQLLKFNNHTDIMGVKVDSIVYKKDAEFKYDKNIFKAPSDAKVETMLKANKFTKEDKFYDFLENDLDFIYEEHNNLVNNPTVKIIYESKEEYFKPYYINNNNIINFDKPFNQTNEHIYNKVIVCGGAGGTGKTTSIMTSNNFIKESILYTTIAWELIHAQKKEYPHIGGLSIPKITGKCNLSKKGKSKKSNIKKYKYIIVDEITLIDPKTIEYIINNNPNCFIILLGDVDLNGKYYQCSLSDVINPSTLNCQYIQYIKSYRFEEELNNKLQLLRTEMNSPKCNKYNIIKYVKTLFKDNFKNKDDVIFNKSDIGISSLQPINKGECNFSNYFYERNSEKQFYVKDTKINNKEPVYKGQILENEPTDNKNYVSSLFRTIHCYQGRQLTNDQRIIILYNSNFDYNLLYTALSRARKLNQIVIIDDLIK